MVLVISALCLCASVTKEPRLCLSAAKPERFGGKFLWRLVNSIAAAQDMSRAYPQACTILDRKKTLIAENKSEEKQ